MGDAVAPHGASLQPIWEGSNSTTLTGMRNALRKIEGNEVVVNEIKLLMRNFSIQLTRNYLSRRQAILLQHLDRCVVDIERTGDHGRISEAAARGRCALAGISFGVRNLVLALCARAVVETEYALKYALVSLRLRVPWLGTANGALDTRLKIGIVAPIQI